MGGRRPGGRPHPGPPDPGPRLVNLSAVLSDEVLPESDREVCRAAYDRIMERVNGLGVDSDPDFATIE